MKKKLSITALAINFLLALIFSVAIIPFVEVAPVPMAIGIVALSTITQYFAPNFYAGKLMDGLQKEVWVPGIKENPIPDTSFVYESEEMSEYVENNVLHLAEAGIEPQVYEDYFQGNEDPLPIADITDIGNDVTLKTYSTEQTRHRNLQDVELQYNKKESVIKRHRNSLAKNIGARAAYSWAPSADDAFNKIMQLGADDSVLDFLIDMEAFFRDLDITEGLNVNLTATHMANIKKEDKKLYKEILNEKMLYGFKVHRYSKGPIYTSALVKKPYGSVLDSGAGDKKASFIWVKNEVFRCFGDTEMYANLRDSGIQADTLSFAQRALVGKIRAQNPKYLGAIV